MVHSACSKRPRPPLGLLLAAALALSETALAAPRTPRAPLNDTGLQRCLVAGSLVTACDGTGQDAEFGRDVDRPRDADGEAGFSFVKIGASGEKLPPDASDWRCVLDRVTGLVWEKKTDDHGEHDYRTRFTLWGDGLEGDVLRFVRSVNREGLCGAADWRMPSRDELLGLVRFDSPAGAATIDSRWFPHVIDELWSGTLNAGDESEAWTVPFYANDSGFTFYSVSRWNSYPVQLVRGGATPDRPAVAAARDAGDPPAERPRNARYRPRGEEVLDTDTGLVWRRCFEGQIWAGGVCTGLPSPTTWRDALAHARDVARSTGSQWRLPNAKEAVSMLDDSRAFPAIDPVFFSNDRAQPIWSSSINPGYTEWAYSVNDWFGSMQAESTDFRVYVRLVRDAR